MFDGKPDPQLHIGRQSRGELMQRASVGRTQPHISRRSRRDKRPSASLGLFGTLGRYLDHAVAYQPVIRRRRAVHNSDLRASVIRC
jgi:hypothetical protein